MNLGKVGFIFNGGGLAGCYSIGFAKALAAKGIKPDYVQGVSVGALTSAKLMSNGWNIEEVEKLWLKIQELGPSSIFNKWDLKKAIMLPQALFDERNILERVIKTINFKAITESPIKYHIVANNRQSKRIQIATKKSSKPPLAYMDFSAPF